MEKSLGVTTKKVTAPGKAIRGSTMSDYTAEDQLMLELLMKKRKVTVAQPPQKIAEPPPSAGAGQQTFATVAALPAVVTDRPLFREPPPQRTYVNGSGVVRSVNSGIDYEYLRDFILGGNGIRGPVGGPDFSQFAVFRSIYDMDNSLFQHKSDCHIFHGSDETYFSFAYIPPAPHWEVKFHAHGRIEPHHSRPNTQKFIVHRVEWFMGKRPTSESGYVLFKSDRGSSGDSASTHTGE